MYTLRTIKAWAAKRHALSGSNVNHSLHAVLTLATFGLWLPAWTILCIRSGQQSRAKMRGNLVNLRDIERLNISPEYRRQLARMS
ncbi:hypothetical protein [Maridesulfovibrio ferrireducens]|uniref:hypothetical protein n=1 Tax=Maridesulfovibrio ferrireducens TaxID=246191 RepID=UPI001A1EEE1B|nr:hypothetical protein [Maridesulfovibrio ferrireducens]MBI9111233.1 hypothetical protein [Maridesulfovibrio ferrireducens]